VHAEIRRDPEGYVIESSRELRINGQSKKFASLSDGDRITLGSTCQLCFRKPIPISSTARLEFVSGHRLPHAVDGVILMAESLVLGSSGTVHIPMSTDVTGTMSLYRSQESMGVRYHGSYTINGCAAQNRSVLPVPAVVSTDTFTLAVEPVGS
jgi:hypothetical protein